MGRAIIRDRFGNGRGNHRNRGDPTSVKAMNTYIYSQ